MPSRQGYHQARPRLPGKHPRETGGLRLAPQIMIVKEWRRMDGCTGKSVKRSNIISTPHPQGAWKTETIMWVRFANSNYMESMDLLEELSAHKKSSTNQDGLKMIWINWPNFFGDASGVDCNIDTNSCISGWTEQRGLCIFAWGFFFLFLFFLHIHRLLFIKWNLRDFSPCWLQPSLNIACSRLLSLKAFLHILGVQVVIIIFKKYFWFANSHGPFLSH